MGSIIHSIANQNNQKNKPHMIFSIENNILKEFQLYQTIQRKKKVYYEVFRIGQRKRTFWTY